MTISVPSVVERADVRVRYVQADDAHEQIRDAWAVLEELVGSLRGRHFVGAFDPLAGWYRACVEVSAAAGAGEQGLPEVVLPGGPHLRVRLKGDPPGVYDEIAPAYELLTSSGRRDDSRPSLEHYRRVDVVDVLMPVL